MWLFLGSKTHPAEPRDVLNLISPSFVTNSYSHALDGLYRVAREGKGVGGGFYLIVKMYEFGYIYEWVGLGWKSSPWKQTGWAVKPNVGVA